MKVLIKNAFIIDPKNGIHGEADLLIEDDIIKNLDKVIDEVVDVVIDAEGLILSPGFVDLHTNFCDPGMTSREDLKTGSMAAIKGGYTTVVLGVENKPAPSECNVIDYIKNFSEIMPINIFPSGALTVGRLGYDMADILFLYNHGAINIYDGNRPIEDKDILKKALEMTKNLDIPLSIYSFNYEGVKTRGINAGDIANKLNLKSGEAISNEVDDLVENIQLINETEAIVDFTGISTKESINILKSTKLENENIFVEVPALNLYLNEKELLSCNNPGLCKVLPPLRSEQDRKALIEGLKDNIIDIIYSNHMPTTEDEKLGKFKDMKEGAIGLETVLGICGLKLVESGHLTWDEVIEKISLNPAILFGLVDKGIGTLDIGSTADITIFDPDENWVVEVEDIVSKSKNTPLLNKKMKGRVKLTITSGVLVYKDKDMEDRVYYKDEEIKEIDE